MGKRGSIITAFCVILTTVAIGWVCSIPKEAHYEGKSLSDWVVEMREGPNRDYARSVVHRMGAKEWPTFLRWIGEKDRPTLKGRLNNLRPDIEEWLVAHKILSPFPITSYSDPKESYRALGLLGFKELGADGQSAIPSLIQKLDNLGREPETMSEEAGAAWLSLCSMAPASVPPLIQALSSSDKTTRMLAVAALGRIGPDAKAAIPALELLLTDRLLPNRLAAAYSLGQIGDDPQKFIPVVVASLQETNLELIDFRLSILVQFKKESQSAIPPLRAILKKIGDSNNPTNVMYVGEITSALRELNAQATTSAEIK